MSGARELGETSELYLEKNDADSFITVVDLASIVVRRKKSFLTATGLIFFLGVLFAFMRPDLYLYSVILEVGSYRLPDQDGVLGQSRSIEEVERAKVKLERHIITSKVTQFRIDNPNTDLSDVKVEAPENLNILVVTMVGEKQTESVNTEILTNISNELLQDHKRRSEEILDQLARMVEVQILKVEELDAAFGVKKKTSEFLEKRLEILKQEAVLLDKQVLRHQEEIDALTKHRGEYLKQKTPPRDAMAILLIDNEIRALRDQRDELEYKRLIELPEKIDEVKKKIDESSITISVIVRELENANRILDRIGGQKIIKEDVDPMAQIDLFSHFVPTKVVVDPFRSVEKVSISKVVILILAAMFAFILGLMVCFVVEFAYQVRGSLASSDENNYEKELS